MKTKIINLLTVFLFIFSCSGNARGGTYLETNDQAKVKRKNIDIDQWVEINRAEIEELRTDWKATIMNRNQELVANQTLTPYQEKALWAGKILEVLELDWTEAERQHLQAMLRFIVTYPEMYMDKTDTSFGIRVEAQTKALNWLRYAKRKLKWDQELLYAIASTKAEMDEHKKINPKFQSYLFHEVDGEFIPHLLINGELVAFDPDELR